MISILIPTLNRSDFLIRALHYYRKVGFKGYVCIGDSSNAQHVEKTKRAIQALKGKLNIIYRTCPSPPSMHIDPLGTPGEGMCVKELIELAPTPYAVYSGDDDFVIPRGLERCAAFLENHSEYSAAHGIRINIRLKSTGAFWQLASAYYSPGHILESELASERWIGYMRKPLSTQYYVHRTETWRRMYQDFPSVPIRYFGSELLPCSFSAILGKIKQIDCLSTVFQINDNRIWSLDTHDMYPFLIHPNWSQSVGGLRSSIVEALAEQDGIDVKRAQEIFDKELWRHILGILQGQYDERYGDLTTKNIFRETLKRIPGLVALVHHLRQTVRKLDPIHKYENLLSLDSLLNLSSPFYADFIPVYHSITTPSELRMGTSN